MEVRKVGLAPIACGHALIGRHLAGNILIDDPQAGSFMAYFEPDQGSTASQKSLVHYQLVKLFLRQCSPHDLSEMTIYLSCYINYFTRPDNHDIFPLHKAVDSMRALATRVKSMEELREIKERLDDCFRVLKEFSTLDYGAGIICCDDPRCSPSKRKAFEEAVARRHRFEQAASRCAVNMTALMSKSEEVGVDWRELLDEEGNPFEEPTEEVCNQFEESRANAVFAFEHYFL